MALIRYIRRKLLLQLNLIIKYDYYDAQQKTIEKKLGERSHQMN